MTLPVCTCGRNLQARFARMREISKRSHQDQIAFERAIRILSSLQNA